MTASASASECSSRDTEPSVQQATAQAPLWPMTNQGAVSDPTRNTPMMVSAIGRAKAVTRDLPPRRPRLYSPRAAIRAGDAVHRDLVIERLRGTRSCRLQYRAFHVSNLAVSSRDTWQ